jgi:hypothetical protein
MGLLSADSTYTDAAWTYVPFGSEADVTALHRLVCFVPFADLLRPAGRVSWGRSKCLAVAGEKAQAGIITGRGHRPAGD